MRLDNVSILGLAHVDAPIRVPSADFERRLVSTMERLGLPAGMLNAVAGIEARRWWAEDIMPSDAAAMAAEKLIKDVGIDRSRIGVVINTSVCRDYIEPSTACLVHSKLKLSSHCLNFDLGNACLAFMNAMEVAGMMIARGQVEYALVVDGESSRHVQEETLKRLEGDDVDMNAFRSEFATLTLGSGAVAMLLCASDNAEGAHPFLGGVSIAATEWSHLCKGQVNYMQTDTRTLLAEGVKLAHRTLQLATDVMEWTPGCLDRLVLHQVSAVHTTKLCQALGLDPDKAHLTFPEFGNIGPASVPYTFSKMVEAGLIKRGDRVGLMGIGSGLNCSMAEVVW